jgi:Tfp pilus assembly ATPase PilU
MQTMNDSLYQLYTNKEVNQEECERVSHDPKEFLRMIGITPLEDQDIATTPQERKLSGGNRR